MTSTSNIPNAVSVDRKASATPAGAGPPPATNATCPQSPATAADGGGSSAAESAPLSASARRGAVQTGRRGMAAGVEAAARAIAAAAHRARTSPCSNAAST
eukprot:365478-Chlamydomonas_euryale.AAC.3